MEEGGPGGGGSRPPEGDVQALWALGKSGLAVLNHEKFSTVSPGACWLWLRALMHLTAGNGALKGVITEHALKRDLPATVSRVAELEDVGLWRRVPEGWKMRRLDAKRPMPKPTHATETETEPESPVVWSIPVVGTSSPWGLTEAQIAEWQQTYESLDVRKECGYAKTWIEADLAGRRKTARGMPRFLVSWLSRALERGNRQPPYQPRKAGVTGPAPAGKYDHLSRADE
jgi:hypothetical protein